MTARQEATAPCLTPRQGFTLMELMLVVIIIALLMTIAVPGISQIANNAKRSASLAMLHLLGDACAAYADDFDQKLPPSKDSTYGGWQGAQLLPLFLTGYAGDANDDGHAGQNGLDKDDGLDDYGFRLQKGGLKYGPYCGAEELKAKQFAPGPRSAFVDAFDNPILYYCFRGGQYNHSDNNSGDLVGPLSNQNYAKDASGHYFRTDFILLSAGPDGLFTSVTESPVTDDITNFLREN